MRLFLINSEDTVLVDVEDYIELSKFDWRLHSKGYAASGNILMHRKIIKAPNGKQVDNINGNKLDNRKCNLRLATNSQNHMNIKKYKNKTSKYKGVYWDKSREKWAADIKLNKKRIRLGRFSSEEAAGLAYNEAAVEFFKEFALLNKIGEK